MNEEDYRKLEEEVQLYKGLCESYKAENLILKEKLKDSIVFSNITIKSLRTERDRALAKLEKISNRSLWEKIKDLFSSKNL